MNLKILLVTDYIIEKDASGRFVPRPKESKIVVAINQANGKMRSQGMESAKVRTQPVLNDGNKEYLRKTWKCNRIETPMLVFVDFAYSDEQAYNVLTTLYGEDMNATKIYETLEYFALLVYQKGKYIKPDGSEWKPLTNGSAGSAAGSGNQDQKGVLDGERDRIPVLDTAIEYLKEVLGKPALYLAAAFCAKQAWDANHPTAKMALGGLSAYLVFRANESVGEKKLSGTPYQDAVKAARRYAQDDSYKGSFEFAVAEMEKAEFRKAELKNRVRYQKILSYATKKV